MIMAHPHPSSHPHKMSQNNNDENSKGLFIQMMRTGAYAGMGACAAAYLFHRMMMMSMPSVASDEAVAVEAARRAQLEASQRAELEAARRAELDAAQRAELEASRRAELEAARRVELEASRRAELEARLVAHFERARGELEARVAAHSESALKSYEARVHQHVNGHSQQLLEHIDGQLRDHYARWSQQRNSELEAHVKVQLDAFDADTKASLSILMAQVKEDINRFSKIMREYAETQHEARDSKLLHEIEQKIAAQNEHLDSLIKSFETNFRERIESDINEFHKQMQGVLDLRRQETDLALHQEVNEKLSAHSTHIEQRVETLTEAFFEHLRHSFEETFHNTERLAREAWQEQIYKHIEAQERSFRESNDEDLLRLKRHTEKDIQRTSTHFKLLLHNLGEEMKKGLEKLENEHQLANDTLRNHIHSELTMSEKEIFQTTQQSFSAFRGMLERIEGRLSALEAQRSE